MDIRRRTGADGWRERRHRVRRSRPRPASDAGPPCGPQWQRIRGRTAQSVCRRRSCCAAPSFPVSSRAGCDGGSVGSRVAAAEAPTGSGPDRPPGIRRTAPRRRAAGRGRRRDRRSVGSLRVVRRRWSGRWRAGAGPAARHGRTWFVSGTAIPIWLDTPLIVTNRRAWQTGVNNLRSVGIIIGP